MVIPTNHVYDCGLVLKKEGTINWKETNTENPYFEIHVDLENGRDEYG